MYYSSEYLSFCKGIVHQSVSFNFLPIMIDYIISSYLCSPYCFTQHYSWHNSIRNDELCRLFSFFDTPLWYAWKSYWCFKHLYQRLCYCVWSIPHGFVSHDSVVDYCCLSRSAAITCSWWKSIIILTLFEWIVCVDLYHEIPHY